MSNVNKSNSNSRVQNNNLTFKNSKNVQAESLLRYSFEPLLSPRDGKARLTFCGIEHSIIEWKESEKQREKSVMKLVFSCLDIAGDTPANIAITCDYRLSEKNRLGQILTIMGFKFEKERIAVVEDDEFGTRVNRPKASEVFEFLRDQCGLVFKGNLTVATRKNKAGEYVERPGLWDIAYSTLEPKLLSTGDQERDMLASEITDQDFENPNITMASDSD